MSQDFEMFSLNAKTYIRQHWEMVGLLREDFQPGLLNSIKKQFNQLCHFDSHSFLLSQTERENLGQIERAVLKNALVKTFTKLVKDTTEDMGRKDIDKKESQEEKAGKRVTEVLGETIKMLGDIERVEGMVDEVLHILENQND